MGQGSEEILCREGVRSWRDKDEATAGHEGGMRVVGVLPAAASPPHPGPASAQRPLCEWLWKQSCQVRALSSPCPLGVGWNGVGGAGG